MGAYAHYMVGKLIAFVVHSKGNRTKSSMFAKKFYGQETSSHEGKYRYRRKGFLDNIPYIKLIRGVIIVSENDVSKVIKFLKNFSAEIHIRTIELTPKDEKVLHR